jgi:hypothetical protein
MLIERFYRLWGLFAALTESLGRVTINFVPLSAIFIIALFIFAAVTAGAAESAFARVSAEGELGVRFTALLTSAVWAGASTVLWAVTVLTFSSIFVRYTIFRPHRAPENPTPAQPTEVRATGEFVLDGKHRRWFIDAPVACERTPEGQVVFLLNADASSSFMGITYANRSGIWSIELDPAEAEKGDTGTLYHSMDHRPALRLTVRRRPKRSVETLIVSFPTPDERSGFVSAAGLRFS